MIKMVKERLDKMGVRVEPVLTLNGLINSAMLLASLLGAWYTFKADQAALVVRVAHVERQHDDDAIARTDVLNNMKIDHDSVTEIRNDVKWLRAVVEKRTQLEDGTIIR